MSKTLPDLQQRILAYHANLLLLRKKESSAPEANVSNPKLPHPAANGGQKTFGKHPATRRLNKDEVVPSVAAGKEPAEAPAGQEMTDRDDYVGGDITPGAQAANNLMALIQKGAAIKGGPAAEGIAKAALTKAKLTQGKGVGMFGKSALPDTKANGGKIGLAKTSWQGGKGAGGPAHGVPPEPRVALQTPQQKLMAHLKANNGSITQADLAADPDLAVGLDQATAEHNAQGDASLGEYMAETKTKKAEAGLKLMSLIKQEIFINHSGKAKGDPVGSTGRLVEVGAVKEAAASNPFRHREESSTTSGEESSAVSEEVSAPGSGGQIVAGKSKPKKVVEKEGNEVNGPKGKASAEKPGNAKAGKTLSINSKAVGGIKDGKHPGAPVKKSRVEDPAQAEPVARDANAKLDAYNRGDLGTDEENLFELGTSDVLGTDRAGVQAMHKRWQLSPAGKAFHQSILDKQNAAAAQQRGSIHQGYPTQAARNAALKAKGQPVPFQAKKSEQEIAGEPLEKKIGQAIKAGLIGAGLMMGGGAAAGAASAHGAPTGYTETHTTDRITGKQSSHKVPTGYAEATTEDRLKGAAQGAAGGAAGALIAAPFAAPLFEGASGGGKSQPVAKPVAGASPPPTKAKKSELKKVGPAPTVPPPPAAGAAPAPAAKPMVKPQKGAAVPPPATPGAADMKPTTATVGKAEPKDLAKKRFSGIEAIKEGKDPRKDKSSTPDTAVPYTKDPVDPEGMETGRSGGRFGEKNAKAEGCDLKMSKKALAWAASRGHKKASGGKITKKGELEKLEFEVGANGELVPQAGKVAADMAQHGDQYRSQVAAPGKGARAVVHPNARSYQSPTAPAGVANPLRRSEQK